MLTDKQAWVLNIIASDEDTTIDALTWAELNQLGCVEPNLNEDDYEKEEFKFDLVTDKGKAALLEYEQDLFKRFDPEQPTPPRPDPIPGSADELHINMRLQMHINATMEAEFEFEVERATLKRLEGMTITGVDEDWTCTLSDVSKGVSPLSAASIEQIMDMSAPQLKVKMIAQTTLLSALSQMVCSEVDKYDIEVLDDMHDLLWPYHPDFPAVSGEKDHE